MNAALRIALVAGLAVGCTAQGGDTSFFDPAAASGSKGDGTGYGEAFDPTIAALDLSGAVVYEDYIRAPDEIIYELDKTKFATDYASLGDVEKRCAMAAGIRFGALVRDKEGALENFYNATRWNAVFTNELAAGGDTAAYATSARRLALKSSVDEAGTCHLVTSELLQQALEICAAQNEADGTINGCSATNTAPAPEPEPTEPTVWDLAADIDLESLSVAGVDPVTNYDYPEDYNGMNLGGTEHVIHSSGGVEREFSFSVGSDYGRTCMQASAIRFETIMQDPPASIVELLETSNWSGSFFNYLDDNANGGRGGAALWAWRTHLVKWNGSVDADGNCELPTYDMVERLGTKCTAFAANNDGEIQGCQVY